MAGEDGDEGFDAVAGAPPAPAAPPRRRLRWLPGALRWLPGALRWLGGVVALLLFLAAAVGFGVDSDAGHRFIVDRIGELRPSSGLRIHIGRLDGSVWRHLRIRDVRLSDPQGIFLEAPDVELDWRPLRWLANRLHVDALTSDLVILRRPPRLRSKPGQPILPGYRIHIGRVDMRLRLDPGVAGARHRILRIVGRADTGRGRAVIGLRVGSTAGDRLALALDTEPDRNIFDLDARLLSPHDGAFPGLLGSRRPMALRIDGQGRWTGWHGGARLAVDGRRIVDLALTEAKGRYALSGLLALTGITDGKVQRLSGPVIRVAGAAGYRDRRVDGWLALASASARLDAKGVIDLAHGAFDPLRLDFALIRLPSLFPNMTGQPIRVHAELRGAFRDAAYRYAAASPRFAFDRTGFEVVTATGAGHVGGHDFALPIRLGARRVTGVGEVAGGILADLQVAGTLHVTSRALTGEGLALRSDKLNGKLALFVDLAGGKYWVSLSGGMQRYLIRGFGIVDVLTELRVLPTADLRHSIVSGRGRAWVRRFDNPFLRALAGGLPSLDTQLVRTPDGLLHFSGLRLTGPAILISGAGLREKDGSLHVTGQGRQGVYGSFRLRLDGMIEHPKIALLLDRPVDALGLDQVRLDLDPVPQGFAMKAAGGSTLGPFTLAGRIDTVPGAPTVIHADALAVSGATAKGDLTAGPGGGFTGRLAIAGGGLAGALDFAPVGPDQHILGHIGLDHAHLAGDFAADVRRGQVDADLLLDPAGTHVDLTATAQGVRRGGFALARLAGRARLVGGKGEVHASVAGSRGRAFAFQTDATIAADSYLVRGQGQIDGKPVALVTPAAMRHVGDAWVVQPTSLSFAGGSATVAGRFAPHATSFEASLDRMPLSVLDMAKPGLGLSGEATGRLRYAVDGAGASPTARADLRVRGLSRAGLVLSSKPVDLGVAGVMDGDKVAARAVAMSGGQLIGRAQARLSLPGTSGPPGQRLLAAPLFAQLRYNGPADTLWRLAGVEAIDLSGPLAIGADIGGTLRDPSIRGSLATSAARLESSTLGSVIEGIHARGRFDGSRLRIDQFTGATRDNGRVAGHAVFDFAGAHGLGMDIAFDASHALLLSRDDISATVTGPMTIISTGHGGTIAGKVRLDRSFYLFGKAQQQAVPHLGVHEVNREEEDEDAARAPVPWALDLTTEARHELFVRGLGLESEWRATLAIKGTIDNPAILGRADLIRGNYQFAGRRFDLDRGVIRFGGDAPVDPALDIVAKANIQGVSAAIQVSGTGLKPEVTFTSTPALPEDELLARLLFGTSIANLSAPEALQLATAVNGLRAGGHGGLDPINAIRKVAGLDRLRIESADVTTGQKTSIAAGKYIGKRTYVEIVTDGQGYSATRVEFQVTRWLTLLSTISTIGRQSANVRISKDY